VGKLAADTHVFRGCLAADKQMHAAEHKLARDILALPNSLVLQFLPLKHIIPQPLSSLQDCMNRAARRTFAATFDYRWPGDEPEDLDYVCGPPSVGSGTPSDEESSLSGDEETAALGRAIMAKEAEEAAADDEAADDEAADSEAAENEAADDEAADDDGAAAAADGEINGTGKARCAYSSRTHKPLY
jgi:hypothetical protein